MSARCGCGWTTVTGPWRSGTSSRGRSTTPPIATSHTNFIPWPIRRLLVRSRARPAGRRKRPDWTGNPYQAGSSRKIQGRSTTPGARSGTRVFGNSVDFQQGRWELRLIPRPVHQYDAGDNDKGTSGALFAMCQGTDPELWLALETRPTAEGSRWHFAFASFTDYAVQARHDSVEVWSCPKYVHGINTERHFVDSVARQVSLPTGDKTEQ